MLLQRLRDELLEAFPSHSSGGLGSLEEVVRDLEGCLHRPTFPYLWQGVKATLPTKLLISRSLEQILWRRRIEPALRAATGEVLGPLERRVKALSSFPAA